MNLHEFVWYSSYDITGRKPGEVKVLLRDVPYPFIGKDKCSYAIYVPRIRLLGDDSMEYQDARFSFDDKVELRTVWNLFKSAVNYLSAFVAASSPAIYPAFIDGRKENIALTAISLVEDAAINAYVKKFHQTLVADFVCANAASYHLFKPLDSIRDEGLKLSCAALLYYKMGMVKGSISESLEKDARLLSSILVDLEMDLKQIKPPYETDGERVGLFRSYDSGKLKALEEVYDQLSRYRFQTSEVLSLPYMNHIGSSSVLYGLRSCDWGGIERTAIEISDHSGIKSDLNMEDLERESSKIIGDWLMSERTAAKVLAKYRQIGEITRFKSFGFPEEDFAEFIRRREEHSRSVRRLVNRLSVVYNISGEDYRHETGGLDLQEAIQVVASRSDRNDVFIDEALQSRSQAWGILVDVSRSLKAFSGEVKDVVLCLTESARRLFQDNRSLGIFAFDDKFYVVKDFTEAISSRVSARIGGLEHGGLTYLPDGVRMTTEILRKRYEDTRIMVVISDGFPSGYTRISEESKIEIRRASRAGIHTIGIGISSEEVKGFFPVWCSVNTPYDLMKSFAKVYLQYALSP